MKLTRILALCLASLTVLSLFAACKDDTSSPSTTAPSVQSDLGLTTDSSKQTTPRITVYAPQAITTRYDYKQSIQDANPNVPISFDTSNDGFHEGRLLADTDRLLADMDWIVLNDYLEVVWCNEGDIGDYAPLFDGDSSTVYEESSSYGLKLASKDGKSLTVHGMIVTWSNHTHNAIHADFQLGKADDSAASLFMGNYDMPPIGTYIDEGGGYELFTIPVTTVNFELDWDMVFDISGDRSFDLVIFMDEEVAIYMGLGENYTVDIVLYGTVN